MTPEAIEAAAEALYTRNAPIAPKWGQLGDSMRSLWRREIADPEACAAERAQRLRLAVRDCSAEESRRKKQQEPQ